MRWYIFALLLIGAVWAGVVGAQRQLAGLPIAPSPAAMLSSLRDVIMPRIVDRGDRTATSNQVPVLMYHHVQALPTEQQGTVDWGLSINPTDFAQQLNWLKQQGYRSVSMSDLASNRLPAKPIVLTFDDGYADFYTTAWPLLRQYGFSATLYVITNRLDQTGFLTSNQLITLAAGEVEIGSHSVSHPNMSKLSSEKLADELVESRATLRRLTAQSVTSFCYPSGQYSDATVAAAEVAGYRTAVTTQEGLASMDDAYTLNRLRIKPSLTLAGFSELLLAQSK
jgi:peptidoglycan/xylan/chitin deacetylase (PgdA/CDA1 family)